MKYNLLKNICTVVDHDRIPHRIRTDLAVLGVIFRCNFLLMTMYTISQLILMQYGYIK